MLTGILSSILGSVPALLSLPGTVELALLTSGALRAGRSPSAAPDAVIPKRFCFVVPAHDEAAGISDCIANLRACDPGIHSAEFVVIADNCTDDTAALARIAGARVLERQDATLRGKGYALDYAFKALLPEGHDIFVVIDADTRVESHLITALAATFAGGAAAAQCRYLVGNAAASRRTRLMHIAWLAFNDLRPRGREFWNLSVGILGNGFALSRSLLEEVPFNADSIAEDLEYHLRLVSAGKQVRFCPATTVWSAMPTGGAAAAGQRARWEGGRFRMIREQVPPLFLAILRGRLCLLEPLLELTLLPLAFHVLLLLSALILGGKAVVAYALAALALVGAHVGTALWLGRSGWRDIAVLASAPFYILWKLALGPRLLAAARREAAWVRTVREPADR